MGSQNVIRQDLYKEDTEQLRQGHYACPGCGVAATIRLVLRSLGKNIIAVIPPSCAASVAGAFPTTSLKVPTFHSAFEITAASASGIANALELMSESGTTVVAFAGDGGTFDIGIQSLSGAADRNDNLIYVCLDNEAYMNTGIQASSATPEEVWTITTPHGRTGRKKHFMEIIAAHRIPYAATATIGMPQDLIEKVKKAQQYTGTRFIHTLTPCPTGWRMAEGMTARSAMLAVETKVFPLFEITGGTQYRITYEPQGMPVKDYVDIQGRYRTIGEAGLERIQQEVDEEWDQLVAKARGCK
jgi:pyruvate/2-oxoacid:ferredoxin oxidoreductase beta subunit